MYRREQEQRQEERQQREKERQQWNEEYRQQQDAKHRNQLRALQDLAEEVRLGRDVLLHKHMLKAAIVQDLVGEVHLRGDVSLRECMVMRLLKGEQMDLLYQPAGDSEVQLGEEPEDEKALAVVTHAQERRMVQQRKDPVETCEENPKEEDTAGIQEVIPYIQVEDSIEGQGSGEEIPVDKDCPLGIEFQLTGSWLGSQES